MYYFLVIRVMMPIAQLYQSKNPNGQKRYFMRRLKYCEFIMAAWSFPSNTWSQSPKVGQKGVGDIYAYPHSFGYLVVLDQYSFQPTKFLILTHVQPYLSLVIFLQKVIMKALFIFLHPHTPSCLYFFVLITNSYFYFRFNTYYNFGILKKCYRGFFIISSENQFFV